MRWQPRIVKDDHQFRWGNFQLFDEFCFQAFDEISIRIMEKLEIVDKTRWLPDTECVKRVNTALRCIQYLDRVMFC